MNDSRILVVLEWLSPLAYGWQVLLLAGTTDCYRVPRARCLPRRHGDLTPARRYTHREVYKFLPNA